MYQGGREHASRRLQACQLLCRYRHSVHIGAEDDRLVRFFAMLRLSASFSAFDSLLVWTWCGQRTWLAENHTLEGLCYAGMLHGCDIGHFLSTFWLYFGAHFGLK